MTKKMSAGKYDEVKALIKVEMEQEGKKYPTNKNQLSDSFICFVFAPKLDDEDVITIDAKRNEFRAKAKVGNDNGKVSNWFPAFRSWVGATYFPEFDAKKAPKKAEDKCGEYLKKLIAERGKAKNNSLTSEERN